MLVNTPFVPIASNNAPMVDVVKVIVFPLPSNVPLNVPVILVLFVKVNEFFSAKVSPAQSFPSLM